MPVSLGAVGAHTYWKVTLQGHAPAASVLHLGSELLVQVPLHPAVVLRFQRVAFGAELRVLLEPVFVLEHELFESRGIHVPGAAGLEGLAYVFHLGLEHARIVQLLKRVELGLLLLECHSLPDSQRLQIDVERVEGKGGYRAVRIRILPFTLACGVVDRQELDDALSRGGSPVHERTQVLEFAYAEIGLGAQGEHRNRGTGAPESRAVEFCGLVLARERTTRNRAVNPLV